MIPPSLAAPSAKVVGRWGKFAAGKIGDGWTRTDGPADDTLRARARAAEARNGEVRADELRTYRGEERGLARSLACC